MKILLLLNVLLVAWLAWRFFRLQPQRVKRYYWSALAFKVLAGFALGGLYFYHYAAGDTISFWKDGASIAAMIRSSPGEALAFLWDEGATPDFTANLLQSAPRSLFFSKICGLAALVSGDNYWMMAAWLSIVAFLGSWFLFRRITAAVPEATPAAAIAFLYLPSVVFWSSGLIKESVGMATLYVLIAVGISIIQGRRPAIWEWLLVGLSLWIGWNLKYYWIGIFLPVALSVVAVTALVRWSPSLARKDLLLWALFLFGLLALGTNVHPNFYLARFMEVVYQNNLEFTRLSDPPRLVQYLNLEPTTTSLLLNAPAALIAGLFRPFVWESFNSLSLLAGIENSLLLILFLQSLPAARHLVSSPHRLFLVAAVTYVILLILFLALSTPNFGTLSRYRIGAIPFLVFLFLGPPTFVGRWLVRRKWFG